jgi:hypothetical protein
MHNNTPVHSLSCATSKDTELAIITILYLWTVVSDIKGGTQTEYVWEQGAEEDIWTYEGWGDGKMEKTA